MKSLRIIGASVLIILLAECSPSNDCSSLLPRMLADLDAGNLSAVKSLADSVKAVCGNETMIAKKADSLSQIAERISIDFSVSEDEIIKRMEQGIGSFTEGQKEEWEKKGWLEYRVLDGKKMYFNRAASNLVLIRKFHEGPPETYQEIAADPEIAFRLVHASNVLKASALSAGPTEAVTMNITYTLGINPDAVPEGELIRCWLPFPRNDNQRQDGIRLIETSETEYIISPDSSIHKTIYMEKPAIKGQPTQFIAKYQYRSFASHSRLDDLSIGEYVTSSTLYRKYTSEQPPQIVFSDEVKKLADSIAGAEKDPRIVARKIYMWFKESIPWAGALEYSIMPDIPAYVIKNRRGDCGMQTFLFMSMLRYKGIPVKWQSGWMVPPEAENLHDWCEIWYEGAGWVPADVSYNLLPSTDNTLREFYLSGIDAYRLIVNEGVSGELYPPKKHLRSEPYDFQRGEVEWKGGNLYFDKWDYDMKIEYKK